MRNLGIRLQVLILALVPTITISFLLVAYFTSTRLQDLEQAFRERGEAIALKAAPLAENAILTQDHNILRKICRHIYKEHQLNSLAFYNAEGIELASQGTIALPFKKPSDPSKRSLFLEETPQTLSIMVPIKHYSVAALNANPDSKLDEWGNLGGWLKIELDNKSIQVREYQVLIHTTMILLLGLSLSGLHALQMGKNVTRPILELAQAIHRIKQGDFTTRVQKSSYRELQTLESGLNSMSQSLLEAKTELQDKIDKATASLRSSLETIEVQNLELDLARQTAEASNQIKSAFLADVSHEIRTPLNGVIGFTNLLKKTNLDEKQTGYLSTIQKSAKTLLFIINDILDFSKIEAGKLKIERRVMNIRESVEDVLTLLEPYANEKNIALRLDIQENLPHSLLADPLRIKQVITNLVNNAIKFTEKGQVLVKLALEGEGEQDFLRIQVIDSGIGIPEEEQEALFQAFHQVNPTISELGGTGLGLSICKKLVEQLEGQIGFESVLGEGSTFWFTAHVQKVPVTFNGISYASMRQAISKKNNNNQFSVLAVDDNPENLKLITILLEELNYNCTALSDGLSAIKAVQEKQFDLILMDVRMPDINGIEASLAIREFEQKSNRPKTPIVALTAHALISEQKALLDAGIDGYLTKPIEEPDLESLLEYWLNEKAKVKNMSAQGENRQDDGMIEMASLRGENRLEGMTEAGGYEVNRKEGNTQDSARENNAQEENMQAGWVREKRRRLDESGDIQINRDAKNRDWDLALKLVAGKKDLAIELFDKLKESLPRDIQQISAQYASGNVQTLRDVVHRLHGGCSYCGVPRLHQAVATLERELEKVMMGKVSLGLQSLQPIITQVIAAAKDLLAEGEGLDQVVVQTVSDTDL